jgi:NitT/TauT family transport system substrate-binding protein
MTEGFKKLLKILLVFAVLGGGYYYLKSTGTIKKMNAVGSKPIPKDAFGGGSSDAPGKLTRPMTVGLCTFPGYSGGPYYNNGFKASENSGFFRDSGLKVQFIQNDNAEGGKAAWRKGAYDAWWCTIDSFPVDAGGLAENEPVMILQSDWSRGADAIVVSNDIKTVADLKGKEIACAIGSPSHTLLLWMLSSNNMSMSDIELVTVQNAIDAASMFKARKVKAAVVWAPDDSDCVANVPGAHVLVSSKTASKIIADCFYVKRSFLDAHPDDVKALVRGWLKGAADINSSDTARRKAAQILAVGFNVDEAFCYEGIGNVRLCTYGDNLNFFGLNRAYVGQTGQKLYEKMGPLWQTLKLASDTMPAWRALTDQEVLRGITDLKRTADLAEGEKQFAKLDVVTEEKLQSISTNRVTINFASGSATLDETAKYIIQDKFGPMVQGFEAARVRVEGNTDNIGDSAMNVRLSKARAQAVVNFLVEKYRLDSDRFVVRGNGMDNPVAGNDTDEGRAANRRTDFELLQEK